MRREILLFCFSAGREPLRSVEGGEGLAGGRDLPTGARGETSGTDPGRLLSLRRTQVCWKEPQGQSLSDPTSGFIPDSIVDVLTVKGIPVRVVMWSK